MKGPAGIARRSWLSCQRPGLTKVGLRPGLNIVNNPPITDHARRWISQTVPHTPTKLESSSAVDVSARGRARSDVDERPMYQVSTSHLLRSVMMGYLFTSPRLFSLSLGVMRWLINSKSSLLDPEKNAVLRFALRKFIYDHFCAGVTPAEVRQKVAEIKDVGFSGVILGFTREIIVDESDSKEDASASSSADQKCMAEWLQGNLDTLDLIGPGDYINMKLTGAGPGIGKDLQDGNEPSAAFVKVLDTICEKARAEKKRVWIDAEQQVFQPTIDKWAIDLMRRYNRGTEAVVYNTVQAYLKASRQNILHHLELAKSEGWVCGIKLVRGAYISSDIRERIWDTKQGTDDNYNSLVHDILSKSFAPFTRDTFPVVDLFIAGHNTESIQRASKLVSDLAAKGEHARPVAYGQLQGMADDVSYELVRLRKNAQNVSGLSEKDAALQLETAPKPYKCLAWGHVGDCMHFLIRRAVENATAADRLKDGLTEVKTELRRRLLPWTS